ncbi:MAG TPA: CHAT domain-containing protein, partial [Burkholderiales bacterium]|nr:CHAT domain-containing protein [Burkholderiales bacterium]
MLKALHAALFVAVLAGPVAAEDARSLAERAVAREQLGFKREALDLLERAHALAPADASIRAALGRAYLAVGDNDKARPHLEAAAALNDLGRLHAAEGRKAEALAAFRQVSGPPLLRAAAMANAAELLPGDEARAMLERADAALAEAPDSREADYARIRHGVLWDAMNIEGKAYGQLSRALDSAQARKDALAESWAAGHLGALYLKAGRGAEAMELTRRAVFAGQRAQADESLYRWSWELARLLDRAGEPEAAAGAYRRALASLQRIRQDVMLDLRAQRRSWRGAVGPLYLEYADLLLRRLPHETLPQARLVEARDTVEQLKAVELEDYFQDDCVAGQLARQKDISRIDERTAVLYPVVLADRLEILVGRPDGLVQATLPVTAAALTTQAHAFRSLLEKRTTNQFMPHARRLYAALFAPLEPLLGKDVETVVFVPDGPLRGIPVAALHDGGRFLVERFAFVTAPGLSLVEPQSLAQRKAPEVLVNGLSEAVQEFPALPYVVEEMEELERVFAGARFLRDRQFRLTAFERALRARSYSIVHIASHGEFDSDPKKSFLLTHDGRLTLDRLEQVMKAARFRE